MVIELIVVGVCLLLNAILACIEMAFVSVSRPQLRQMAHAGNKDAQRLMALRDNPERTLSVIQVGITLVAVVSAAVGGAGADEFIAPILQERWGLSERWAEILSIVMVVLPITFLSVVLGELVPKTVALKRPLQISFLAARWLRVADRTLAPVVSVLEWCTKVVLKYLFPRLKPERGHEAPGIAVEIDSLSDHHRQYLMNLAHLERKRIKDIMVAWPQVATIEWDKTAAEVAAVLLTSGHSRIPVFKDGEITGFVYSKEFMALSSTGSEDWHSIIRPILRVLEGDSLLRVMRLMQERRSHLALVYSAERTLTGIVTLEDIIEEVVGEIYDEDDDGNLKRILAAGGRLRETRLAGNRPAMFGMLQSKFVPLPERSS